jgi:hypothetical protein
LTGGLRTRADTRRRAPDLFTSPFSLPARGGGGGFRSRIGIVTGFIGGVLHGMRIGGGGRAIESTASAEASAET